MKWMIFLCWFFSAISMGAEHRLLFQFDRPVDLPSILHQYHIHSVRVVPGSWVYQVTVVSSLTPDGLRQELTTLLNPLVAEREQELWLTELEDAATLDSRAIFVLDDLGDPTVSSITTSPSGYYSGARLDSRAIFVLDENGGAFEPLYRQNYVDQVRAHQAWPRAIGRGSVVAVLDTGVDLDHDFLRANLEPGWDFVGDDDQPDDEQNHVDDNGNGRIDEGWGHGTHVAGVLKSIAPGVRIMPIRVANSDGQANMIDLISGIAYAIDQGAHVINLSLSISQPSTVLERILKQAQNRGILVVTSAGNENQNAVVFPADNNRTVAVSSVDSDLVKSDFSNYSRSVDMAAPGEFVVSCLPGNRYVGRSGTSMAAPMVSAAAAILLELEPRLAAQGLSQIMKRTAQDIDRLNPEYRRYLGNGLLDVAAAADTCK